jgi:hypothetical protein
VHYRNDPMVLENAVPEGAVSGRKRKAASRLKPEVSKYSAVEVAAAGASYRPDAAAHKALMGPVPPRSAPVSHSTSASRAPRKRRARACAAPRG